MAVNTMTPAPPGPPPRIVMAGLTFRQGGAAGAARRLQTGLESLGCPVTRYVWARDESGSVPGTVALRDRLTPAALDECRERGRALTALFAPYGDRDSLRYRFSADLAAAGPAFVAHLPPADILNFHWMAEFLDTPSVWKALPTHQPVVWTLHDLNPFTGGCHYPGSCRRFETGCGCCPLLGGHHPADLSAAAFARKRAAYAGWRGRLHFVAPSRWIGEQARASGLAAGRPISVIPNAVDTSLFAPQPAAEARIALGLPTDTDIVLFLSSALADPRKGLDVLVEAIVRLPADRRPLLLTVGSGEPPEILDRVANRTLGFVDDPETLLQAYAAADIVAVPTREDNLPNVVLEAFACGRPVVASAVGGLPDMVEPGCTGWLVPAGDAEALARVLKESMGNTGRRRDLGTNARRRALDHHTPERQAGRYLDLFRMLLDEPAGLLT